MLPRDTTTAGTTFEDFAINQIFHDQDLLSVEKSGIEEQRKKEQGCGQSRYRKENEIRVPNHEETDQERYGHSPSDAHPFPFDRKGELSQTGR